MTVGARGGTGLFIGGRTVIFGPESNLLAWYHRKPIHARRYIPRDTDTEYHWVSSSMVACCRGQSTLLYWGDASWVAMTLMQGT